MKLLNKEEGLFLSKQQIRKVCLAVSIMTLVLYAVAMVFSLCGSDMFILNYQNAQMEKIQEFLYKYSLQAVVQNLFITLEVTILLWFILGKTPKWYYVLTIYVLPLAIYYLLKQMPSILETSLILVFCLVMPHQR